MTDEQYQAKTWLMRLDDYAKKLNAEKRTLEMLQDRLYKGVSKYDGPTGRKDPTTARAAHEDALIDFSEQAAKVEKAKAEQYAELQLRHEVIDAIPQKLQGLAIDRYINGIKWEKLADIYNYSRSNVFEINKQILDNVAEVLNAKKTPLIITQTNKAQEATA